MSENYFDSKQIAPDTWVIHDHMEKDGKDVSIACYLLAGDRQALLIDTGFGNNDIRAYAETLTNRPVRMAANTEGLADQCGGNHFMKCAFMTPQAEKNLRGQCGEGGITYDIVSVRAGFKIDLGNRDVEVFTLDGHTEGSAAFLDKKHRILFMGNNIGFCEPDKLEGAISLWNEAAAAQPSLYTFSKDLAKIVARSNEFDLVGWGRGGDIPLESIIVQYAMLAMLKALDGTMEDVDPAVRTDENQRMCRYKDAVVIFDQRTMR
jgi:hypothetical protein